MKKTKDGKKESLIGVIITTALGGIALLFASVFLNAFLSSPPTRAEFDSFKATINQQNIHIDKRLERLENGQNKIINLMINKGENHDRQK